MSSITGKIEEIGSKAEIAVQHLAEIGDELVEQALVQPVLLTDGASSSGLTCPFSPAMVTAGSPGASRMKEVQAQYQNGGRPPRTIVFSADTHVIRTSVYVA